MGIQKITVLLLLFFQIAFSVELKAQINTEIMRKTNLSEGLYNNFTFSLGYIDGNSELLSIKSGYRTDWIKSRHYAFFIGNYQRATNRKQLSLNKGFVHLRYVYQFVKQMKGEVFTQKEFNDFILIKDRQLFGGGLRMEIIASDTSAVKNNKLNINIGTGFMYENEKFNKTDIPNTKIIRSTNYLSSKYFIDEKISIIAIGYYQVNLKKTNDFRILMDSGLGFHITKNFLITTTANFRYDNEPPLDIKKYDLEITNGISINF
jgi:hypothetical protein